MKKINKNTGITLIALIISVIIMLILAGVSIAVITSDNGLFNKTNSATKEYKKQNLIEVIKTAELYLNIDNQFDKTKEIDIVSLINKVKEISDVNDKDYLIYIDEVGQSATIIDKKTGIVIDIWIDEKKNLNVEGSIVDNIDDAAKPTIEYTLDPVEGEYGETIKITITVKEEKNGITKIQFPDNAEKTYSNEKIVIEEYSVTQNGKYKFIAENANGRKTIRYIEVKNAMSAANIVMEVKNADLTVPLVPTNDKVNVVINYDENAKVGGESLINVDRFQYSIGENHWQTATTNPITIPVTENGIVYARYFDGTNGYKTTSITVANIDKESPNEFELSANVTINSVIISGETIDKGSIGIAEEYIGISGYKFQLKDSTGIVIADWTTKQMETSYEFTGLTEDTSYKVNMKAIDLAGNEITATNGDLDVTTITNKTYLVKEGKQLNISFWPKKATINTDIEDNVYIETYYTAERAGAWVDIDVTDFSKLYIDAEISFLNPIASIAASLFWTSQDIGSATPFGQFCGASGGAYPRTTQYYDVSSITGTIRLFIMKSATPGNSNAVYNIYNLWLEK